LARRFPFPLLHVDTGHNFPETTAFRDAFVARTGARLIVRTVEDSIKAGRAAEEPGANPSRNALQTVTLLDALAEFKFDAASVVPAAMKRRHGPRSGSSPSRRVWAVDPKNQRPELWNLFNGRKHPGEHFRVFPLSNWTEMDVWQYIAREKLDIPSIYFSHLREVVSRDGVLLAKSPHLTLLDGETYETRRIRFRTVGDMTCTGAVESEAATLAQIIQEVAAARQTERGTRADDRRSETAMEDRKKTGYF